MIVTDQLDIQIEMVHRSIRKRWAKARDDITSWRPAPMPPDYHPTHNDIERTRRDHRAHHRGQR